MVEIPRDSSAIPPEVLGVLEAAKVEEDKLRALGASEERIKSKVALGRKLAMLAARGYDISAVLPPETDDEPVVEDQDLTPEEEAMIDRLDAMGVMNIAEAIRRVKNKRQ